MRRFVSGLIVCTLLASVSLPAEDAKPKKAAKKSTVNVQQQFQNFQDQLKEQQSQIQQQQSQIEQLQQQLQQSNSLIQQQNAQNAQLQNGVQQANQQSEAAQQAASNLSASVSDLKASTAENVKVATDDHKKLDKIINPDAYAPKPTIINAVAPIRALPIDAPAKDGLVPSFRLGLVRVTPYGFIKATAVQDSSSPRGDDFPLPGFLNADSGPGGSPEIHIKARSTRFGSNFEWPDASKNLTVTGKFEFDWEGMFSRVDNRNVSAIRSNAPTIRLAFVRMDYTHQKTDWFFEAGQDWTPFGSSTLPNLLETTGLGIAYGSLYERQPLMRVGFVQKLGGTFKFSPEVAIVMPAYGNLPAAVAGPTGLAPVGDAGLGNQLGYGERQGADSDRPEWQARAVLQWQLDPAKGVAPAQFIVSGVDGRRRAQLLASTIASYAPAYAADFPNGAEVTSKRWGGTIEAQLPTRWATLVAKIYRGADLRYYFAGELFSNYTQAYGLTGLAKVPDVDGSSTVVIGTNALGQAVLAPQLPARSNGGFVNLGLPLSRWFNANPAGRNAGWQMYLHWGVDQVESNDLHHILGTEAGRARSRLAAATLYYKLNPWCTFAFEQSLYTTVADPSSTGGFLKVNGRPSREWNDRREEFGPVFTF